MQSYTGSGAYCYANSLHMCLRAAGAGVDLPAPGFLECLTVMPFGASYLRLPAGATAFLSPITTDPDAGITLALNALGWTCDEWGGDNADEALACLRDGLAHGPVLLGPLDNGFLPYYPGYKGEPGGDHYVVALAIEGEAVRLHDPAGYPYAVAPLADALMAWRADSVEYQHIPYRMRARFRQTEARTRANAIARTLPHIRAHLTADPGGPIKYGGRRALQLLADDLRGPDAARFGPLLTRFHLPLAARRALDAAAFLADAGHPEAAALLDRKARCCGAAQLPAARGDYDAVAVTVDEIAAIHEAIAAVLA